jgi:uncharacterized protein (TIGR02594 family)
MTFDESEKKRIEGLVKSAKINKDLSWYRKNCGQLIVDHYDRYMVVAETCGVPPVLIALIHMRECASDLGKFKSNIANGQPFNKVTTIVPKGRGPFSTWESAAIDALKLMKFNEVHEWSLERLLFELERHNGFGYRKRLVNTPYVWNYTNHYSAGQFIKDGVYSQSAVDKNAGAFALYDMLKSMDGRFAIGADIVSKPVVEDVEEGFWTKAFRFISELWSHIFTAPVEMPKKEEAPLVNRNLLLLMAASREIGVKEIAGSKSSIDVMKYHSAVTGKTTTPDSVPWCASFVAWVLESCAMQSTNSMSARSYEYWGLPVKPGDCLPGDVAVFWRGSKTSGLGHVAFVVAVKGSTIYCLGGNQNNAVNITKYQDDKLLSFRRSAKAYGYSKTQVDMLFEASDKLLSGQVLEAGRQD